MKYEWRKNERDLYLPKNIQVTEVPKMTFITLSDTGNPNNGEFGIQIQALYSLSYAARMLFKQQGFEYTVYPLEGVWTTIDGSRGASLNKSALTYQIMIRQPDQLTKSIFKSLKAATIIKKPNPYLEKAQLITYDEGLSVQTIHVGSFDTEGDTFQEMQIYLDEHHLVKSTTMGEFQHREIYLSDFRRIVPEKRKTLLRYRITK